MKRRVIAILMVICMIAICSCSVSSNEDSAKPTTSPKATAIAADKTSQQVAFDVFTDELFEEKVQNDSITLNYTLAHPETYGITGYTPTFGHYSIKDMEETFAKDKNTLNKLSSFEYEELTRDQQITYEILKELYTNELKFKDYMLYDEVLSSTTGLQAQLPVLLAEYNFSDKEDVTDYIALLATTDSYFKEICEFQKQKSAAGLFMSDISADNVIDQCRQFIKDPEKNLLITVFDNKLDSLSLSKEEKTEFLAQNKDAVLTHVIPAYEELIATLTSLKGTGKNDGGLCHFKNGTTYYSMLLKNQTGSSKTPEEARESLQNVLYTAILRMQEVVNKDSKALENAQNAKYKLTEPRKIINSLKESIKKDFPDVQAVNCEIKYVDKSLEEHMSPAFYLTPQIDCYTKNCIYINKCDKYDLSDLFTTLAHEGYPGHLYQNVYYASLNPSLIRNIIDFGGYSEGWATYVEMYSYGLAGLEKNVASILRSNNEAILCIYGLADIGVNYTGWTVKDLKEFLSSMGINNEEAASLMFQAVIDEPCNYLKYALGYAEIKELRDKAKNALGKSFKLKEFHEFLLTFGPAQFDIINKYLDQWIKEKSY